MATYGLILIVAAWLLQFLLTSGKSAKIQPLFVAFYTAGVLLLVLDGFPSGLTLSTILNLVSMLVSFAVLVKIYR